MPSKLLQPRIEELPDDSSDSDPSEDDLDDFAPTASAGFTNPALRRTAPAPSTRDPNIPSSNSVPLNNPFKDSFGNSPGEAPPQNVRSYTTLYPIYFDRAKTRAQGRRVGKKAAVSNPLAREIVDAAQALNRYRGGSPIKIVFEPGKTHPKDWSNPGRVRLGLKEDGSGWQDQVKIHGTGAIKNKHHLYHLISEYLRAHPTTVNTPLRLRIQGVPHPSEPPPPPIATNGRRGKLNTILPLHSPALSGGGVSENILGDMMKEMQEGGGRTSGMGGPSDMSGMLNSLAGP